MAAVSGSVSGLPSIKPDILLRVKMEGVTSERSSQTPAPKMEEESKDSGTYAAVRSHKVQRVFITNQVSDYRGQPNGNIFYL